MSTNLSGAARRFGKLLLNVRNAHKRSSTAPVTAGRVLCLAQSHRELLAVNVNALLTQGALQDFYINHLVFAS